MVNREFLNQANEYELNFRSASGGLFNALFINDLNGAVCDATKMSKEQIAGNKKINIKQ